MSIWHMTANDSAGWSQWRLIAEKELEEDGKTIKRWERSKYEKKSQLRYTENRYELMENGVVVFTEEHRRSPEMRDYTLAQLTEMLQQAGYSEIHAVSGLFENPDTEEDEVYNIFGKKPKILLQ